MRKMATKYSGVVGMVLAAVLVSGGSAHSYEVLTHENLTRLAFDHSVLADPTLSPLLIFGVEDQQEEKFWTRRTETGMPWEAPLEARLARPRDVAAMGAHFEDIPMQAGRFLRHFYDPQQSGIGLTVAGVSALPSPTWVLEDQGDIASQQDSLRDALEFHRLALSGPQQASRDENLARLLEILGRSVHHLQDMSQPAHVRNDAHQPGDGDIYEDSTNKRFGGPIFTSIPVPNPNPRPGSCDISSVDLAVFDTARKFWSDSGRGIAEFTSNNFVSKDTNFRGSLTGYSTDPDHDLPTVAGIERVTLGELGIGGVLTPSFAAINFLHTQVQDAYLGIFCTNNRASTWSLFDPDLSRMGLQPRMTLNSFNFQKNYEILLPRAIAYSAGLINYYFRGRFELEEISTANGLTTMTVRNASAPAFRMGEGNGERFHLYYDALDGQRRAIAVEELDEPDAAIEFDATRRFSFTAPADLDVRKERPYTLVFDGVIGTERGMAALAFGAISSGFRIVPSYVPANGVAGARRVTWNNINWSAVPVAEDMAGEIDWKGHDPRDVLTWGNGRRYHSSSGGGPVYMNGRVLTSGVPDLTVIGASIRYLADGQRLLNVAAYAGNSLRIYSRTFAERYENDEAWSESNPLGWRLVYSGSHGAPYTGFFFNASGNEGQYLTRNADDNSVSRRVKINLQGYSATAVEFPAVATVTRTERQVNSTAETLDIQAGICFVSPGYPYGTFMSGGEGCGIEYSGTENRVNQRTVSEQYADRTLFCVDYRGDQEVFCELLPPSSLIVDSTLDQTLIDDHVRTATNPWCPLPDARDTQFSRTITQERNRIRTMRIGNLEIPWSGENKSESRNAHWGGAFRNPVNYAGGDTNHLTSNSRTALLIQFDARHDFAVYQERFYESVNEYTSSYGSAGGPSPSNSSQSFERGERVVMLLGGQREVLFDDSQSESTETPGTVSPPLLPYDGLRDCQPRPGSDQSTTTTFVDVVAATNIFSNMSFYGSYAIDRAGRLALSQRITQFEFPYANRGYRNFLTGGDLPTLIPGTPPNSEFWYEIRLIR